MAESCNDRFPEILKDFLGEENYRQCRKLGLTDNRLMNLYHQEFDRDQGQFRSAVQQMLDEQEVRETDRMVKEQIQTYIQSIEKLQELRIGVVEDFIKEHGGTPQ